MLSSKILIKYRQSSLGYERGIKIQLGKKESLKKVKVTMKAQRKKKKEKCDFKCILFIPYHLQVWKLL